MHPITPKIDKALISQTDVCKAIGQTRSGLAKLRKKDPTFPSPIKFSDTRQATAYYVVAEVEAWLKSKIEARDACIKRELLPKE